MVAGREQEDLQDLVCGVSVLLLKLIIYQRFHGTFLITLAFRKYRQQASPTERIRFITIVHKHEIQIRFTAFLLD